MRIGFTGHRPNRLHIGADRVAARLGEVCARLKAETAANQSSDELIAISPLAEGSDRLFAETALALGFTLHALLPMPAGDYEQTFEDASMTPAFRALLTHCEKVDVLPGSLADSTGAYAALGHAMAATCDVLVTVWDGKPAAGRGGTPEVIEHALNARRRVIWVDAGSDRTAVELRAITPSIETLPLAE